MRKLTILIVYIFSGLAFVTAQSVSNVSISGIFTEGKTVSGNFDGDPGSLSNPNYYFEFFGIDNGDLSYSLQAGSSPDYEIQVGDNIYRLKLRVVLRDNTTGVDTAYSPVSQNISVNSLPYIEVGTASIIVLTNLNVGSTLYADYNYVDIDGDSEGDLIFSWLRKYTSTGIFGDIVGANQAYTIQPGDTGHYFRCNVTAVAAEGNTGVGGSDLSLAIGRVNRPPVITGLDLPLEVNAGQEILADSYTYSDPDGDPAAEEFIWLRDGNVIGGENTNSYLTTSEDGGTAIQVIVTPKSSSGYPDTGIPDTSNVCNVVSVIVPIAYNVCIDGERFEGEILTGEYEYNRNGGRVENVNQTEHYWYIGNNPVPVHSGKTYTVESTDIGERIVYEVVPHAWGGAVGDSVSSAPMAKFDMVTYFSNQDDDVLLVASPIGGTFYCDSGGIAQNRFTLRDRIPGEYIVQYNTSRIENQCYQTTYETLTIDESVIEWAMEDRYCFNEGNVTISVSNLPVGALPVGFSLPTNPSALVSATANSAIVSINTLGPGNEKDEIVFTYINMTIFPPTPFVNRKKFVIDEIGDSLKFTNIVNDFCENSDSIRLQTKGRYPDNGLGSWSTTGSILSDIYYDYAYIDPSLQPGGGTVSITYTYIVGGCSDEITFPVTVNPKPVVHFDVDDRCIDFEGDTTRFINTTICDSVETYSWDFGESGVTSTLEEPGHPYISGGTKAISLTVTSDKGCVGRLDSIIVIARKPVSDFKWEDDCYYENEDLLLIDNSDFTESVDSVQWIINDTDIWRKQGARYDTTYTKTNDAEIIKVDYILETPEPGCRDTITKKIYIRPVYTISQEDYIENFNSTGLGWFTEALGSDTTWASGIPERFGADPGSVDSAWFTNYDMLNQLKAAYTVESPCFDFRGIERPMISMDVMRRFDRGRDGAILQYRVGNSDIWENIGGTFYGINWYQNSNIFGRPGGSVVGWSPEEEDDNWVEARQYLDELIGLYDVKLRVAYGSAGPSEGNLENEGFAFDNIRIGERTRNVLIEHFTNSQEANSPAADDIINNIDSVSSKDALNIQYHTDYVAGDPFYIENTADPSSRVLYYGLSRVPYALYDGGFNTPGSWASKYTFETGDKADINDLRNRSLVDPYFQIALGINSESGFPGGYKVDIKALQEIIDAEDITLFIAVIAEKATSAVIDNGQTVFRNVLRKMYPDAGGISMETSWSENDSTTYEFNLDNIMANSYDIDTIKVIAFLQNNTTKEVYQSAVSEPLKANVTSIGRLRFEEAEFSIFPNPANRNLTLLFDSEIIGNSRLTILNNIGVAVRNIDLQAGIDRLTIDDLNLPGGFYMVQVVIDGEKAGLRKLIVANR